MTNENISWFEVSDRARERMDLERETAHKLINENKILRERLDRIDGTFEAFVALIASYGRTHDIVATDERFPRSARDRFQSTAKLARAIATHGKRELNVARMDF